MVKLKEKFLSKGCFHFGPYLCLLRFVVVQSEVVVTCYHCKVFVCVEVRDGVVDVWAGGGGGMFDWGRGAQLRKVFGNPVKFRGREQVDLGRGRLFQSGKEQNKMRCKKVIDQTVIHDYFNSCLMIYNILCQSGNKKTKKGQNKKRCVSWRTIN